jgi:hypothetical protein
MTTNPQARPGDEPTDQVPDGTTAQPTNPSEEKRMRDQAPAQPAVPAAASPFAAPPTYLPPVKKGARPGVIVWGLIVTLVGLLISATFIGMRFDPGLFTIVFLLVAGLALLVGALVAATRGHAKGTRR